MVFFVLIRRNVFRQFVQTSINTHAGVAAAPGVFKDFLVLALFAAHDRGENLKFCPFRQAHDLINDLVNRLTADLLAALRAVRRAAARPQKAQIVIDLRDRANGRAGIAAGGLLVDGDGGGKAVDGVNVRLVHLAEEHARVTRK